jgi:hypothetical protein
MTTANGKEFDKKSSDKIWDVKLTIAIIKVLNDQNEKNEKILVYFLFRFKLFFQLSMSTVLRYF